MGYFKGFLTGVSVSFVVYYLTRKDKYGYPRIDDMLDNPEHIIHKLKELAITQIIKTVKSKI